MVSIRAYIVCVIAVVTTSAGILSQVDDPKSPPSEQIGLVARLKELEDRAKVQTTEVERLAKELSAAQTQLSETHKEVFTEIPCRIAAAKKEAISKGNYVEWQTRELKPNHPFTPQTVTLMFKNKVVAATVMLAGFQYKYPGDKEDHEVGEIAAVCDIQKIDGTNVEVSINANMFDWSNHVADREHIRIVVLAITDPPN